MSLSMRPFLLASEGSSNPLIDIFAHSQDHRLEAIPPLRLPLIGEFVVTKFMVMVALSALVLILAGLRARPKGLVSRGFFGNAFETLVLFIRDGLVRPAMGKKDGDRFVPFFCTIFAFIFTMNLMGLVPVTAHINGTATSNPVISGTLAAVVLLVGLVSGFVLHGPGGVVGAFIPGGLPAPLRPVLFVLELLGWLVKHAVLMIRLSANMTAGHLVLGSFVGLNYLFANVLALVAPASIALALFVTFLELLVSFLQAYVFTLISVVLMGTLVHPDH